MLMIGAKNSEINVRQTMKIVIMAMELPAGTIKIQTERPPLSEVAHQLSAAADLVLENNQEGKDKIWNHFC
jgi:hypothetical protein